MDKKNGRAGETFRIGTVSRLTGLSAHTLRKWEARYQALAPRRGERGERYYTQEDIERLSMLKRLVDAGAAPREVAALSLAELKRKAEQLAAAEHAADEGRVLPLRAVVVGSGVAALFARRDRISPSVEAVASAISPAELGRIPDGRVDVLVYESPIVQGDTRQSVESLRVRVNAAAAVVVYEFGTREHVRSLQAGPMTTLRAPADLRTLVQVVLQIVGANRAPRAAAWTPRPQARPSETVRPPRLPREVVARIGQAAPKIQCECPRHLADILLSLRAFEDYSAACEISSPEDAALHHYLWRSAATARALFEDAIERVAEAESIPLGR